MKAFEEALAELRAAVKAFEEKSNPDEYTGPEQDFMKNVRAALRDYDRAKWLEER